MMSHSGSSPDVRREMGSMPIREKSFVIGSPITNEATVNSSPSRDKKPASSSVWSSDPL